MLPTNIYLLFLATLAFLSFVGCSKPTPIGPSYGSDDGKLIADVIDEFNDARSDQNSFSSLFTGKKQWTAKKYDPFRFEIEGQPDVTSNSATARIKVLNDGDGKERGTQTWSFVKEGEKWKIKTAPLP